MTSPYLLLAQYASFENLNFTHLEPLTAPNIMSLPDPKKIENNGNRMGKKLHY